VRPPAHHRTGGTAIYTVSANDPRPPQTKPRRTPLPCTERAQRVEVPAPSKAHRLEGLQNATPRYNSAKASPARQTPPNHANPRHPAKTAKQSHPPFWQSQPPRRPFIRRHSNFALQISPVSPSFSPHQTRENPLQNPRKTLTPPPAAAPPIPSPTPHPILNPYIHSTPAKQDVHANIFFPVPPPNQQMSQNARNVPFHHSFSATAAPAAKRSQPSSLCLADFPHFPSNFVL